MARTSRLTQASIGNARSEVNQELIERELKLEDPIKPEPPQLSDLLHPDVASFWPDRFRRSICAALDRRRNDPIPIPDGAILRPLLMRCSDGHSGKADLSSEWRQLWGTDADQVQAEIRGTWHLVRAHRYPKPERYEQLVSVLADTIIDLHQAALERQRERQAKQAERKGPVARAHAAHAVLEHVTPLRAALAQFDAATRGISSPWNSLALGLDALENAAKGELS